MHKAGENNVFSCTFYNEMEKLTVWLVTMAGVHRRFSSTSWLVMLEAIPVLRLAFTPGRAISEITLRISLIIQVKLIPCITRKATLVLLGICNLKFITSNYTALFK